MSIYLFLFFALLALFAGIGIAMALGAPKKEEKQLPGPTNIFDELEEEDDV